MMLRHLQTTATRNMIRARPAGARATTVTRPLFAPKSQNRRFGRSPDRHSGISHGVENALWCRTIAPGARSIISRYQRLGGSLAPLEGGLTRYISTRGEAPVLGFCDVMLTGLARDGGLYVPETWPQLSPETIAGFFGRPYWEVAVEVIRPFVGGEISDADLGRMANEAYATFRHPAVVPLDQTGPNQFLLELFHGPTLAFKDVAMQLISRLMDHVLAKRAQRTTIVVATSGDTGGAAVDAFADLDNVDLIVLFPNGRISDVQRRMMTTIGRVQRSCTGDRRHFRRLPGDREGDVQPSRLSRRGRAVRRQLDQLGADRGPGGVLLHLGGRARIAVAHRRFHRADRKFRRHLRRLRRQAHGPAGALAADRRQHQRHPAAHAQDRDLRGARGARLGVALDGHPGVVEFRAAVVRGQRPRCGERSPADGVAEAVRAFRAAGRDAGAKSARSSTPAAPTRPKPRPRSAPPGARPAISSIPIPRWRLRSPTATRRIRPFPTSCCRPRMPRNSPMRCRPPAACGRNCRPGSRG